VILSQFEILKEALFWDASEVSKRIIYVDGIAVSGHDGEWLGVLMGAWGAMLRLGKTNEAKIIEEHVEHIINKETEAFRKLLQSRSSPASDTILLKLSTILTHNAGDIDQR
jgi:hypothetical protein